jgi:hypothetical protein
MFNLMSVLVIIIAFLPYCCLDACAVEVIAYDLGLFLSLDVNMNVSLMASKKDSRLSNLEEFV